jgi:hypothetical protein
MSWKRIELITGKEVDTELVELVVSALDILRHNAPDMFRLFVRYCSPNKKDRHFTYHNDFSARFAGLVGEDTEDEDEIIRNTRIMNNISRWIIPEKIADITWAAVKDGQLINPIKDNTAKTIETVFNETQPEAKTKE